MKLVCTILTENVLYFQNTIFWIIENVANEPTYRNEQFVVKWKNIMHKHGINGKTSFSKIKCCLHFEDIKSYLVFLQKCPMYRRKNIII